MLAIIFKILIIIIIILAALRHVEILAPCVIYVPAVEAWSPSPPRLPGKL